MYMCTCVCDVCVHVEPFSSIVGHVHTYVQARRAKWGGGEGNEVIELV